MTGAGASRARTSTASSTWPSAVARPVRPDAEPPPSGSGAGLGLAIVRGLIEVHHGRVEVENVENGCQFVVTIPTTAAASA